MDKIAELWLELYERNSDGCVRQLLELDPIQAKVTNYGFTLLHAAAGSGDFDEVRSLLENGAEVNRIDTEGDTALHRAAAKSDPRICRILLMSGASVTVKNRNGQTPLVRAERGSISATEEDYAETVRILKEASGKPESSD